MCCAIFKPADVAVPKTAALREIWKKNPHGAGFCYPSDGKLKIRKGFLDCDEFFAAVRRIPKGQPCLIHMRIATSGGINPGMTHPFPVWDYGRNPRYTAEETECGVALVHNGILPYRGRNGVSDTCELAMRLTEIGGNPYRAMLLLEPFLGERNKVAMMGANGKYRLYGEWTEHNGIYYSNMHWQMPKTKLEWFRKN